MRTLVLKINRVCEISLNKFSRADFIANREKKNAEKQLYRVRENLQIYNATHAKRQTKWKQDSKVATNNNKKASGKCPRWLHRKSYTRHFWNCIYRDLNFIHTFIIYRSYLY